MLKIRQHLIALFARQFGEGLLEGGGTVFVEGRDADAVTGTRSKRRLIALFRRPRLKRTSHVKPVEVAEKTCQLPVDIFGTACLFSADAKLIGRDQLLGNGTDRLRFLIGEENHRPGAAAEGTSGGLASNGIQGRSPPMTRALARCTDPRMMATAVDERNARRVWPRARLRSIENTLD